MNPTIIFPIIAKIEFNQDSSRFWYFILNLSNIENWQTENR